MKYFKGLIAGFFMTMAAMPVSAQLVIEHAQGTYQVNEPPQKVITFDLASLDTMDALGVDVIGLPKSFAQGILAKFDTDKYLNVGSLFEPDYELVAAQQADLVIVANRSAKAYKSLAQLGDTIDLSIGRGPYVQQIKDNSRRIARIFSKQAVLQEKLDQLDSKMTKVQQLAKTAGNALFILTNGGKISAYGLGSRFGWLHQDLAITPAIKDIKAATHGDPISFEFILDTNPDWIFVIDRDAAIGKQQGAAQALLDNELMHQTKAAKNQQIVYLDAFNWYILAGGITALDNSVQEVLSALSK